MIRQDHHVRLRAGVAPEEQVVEVEAPARNLPYTSHRVCLHHRNRPAVQRDLRFLRNSNSDRLEYPGSCSYNLAIFYEGLLLVVLVVRTDG